MQLELAFQPPRGAVLRIASSPEAAWTGGIADWFAGVAKKAWITERPAIVAVPTRSHAHALKARVLAAGESVLGLHFVTPPFLRELLQVGASKQIALPEHLRLLLAAAAEEHLTDQSLTDAERLAAVSVRRTPDHLLRLIDQLQSAGWPFESADLPAFHRILERFRAHLAACDFDFPAEADRAALERARKQPPLFGDLLIT
ncbi:MAG: hypothetical protein ABR589_06895, partial [Chthoniobacterales bacterium]